MRELFVTYEQALALNKLGFNEECLTFYYNKELAFGSRPDYGEVVEAPLKQQAFRWFREKYEIHGFIIHYSRVMFSRVMFRWCIDSGDYFEESIKLDTYEEAENACIDKSIELVKKQKDGK